MKYTKWSDWLETPEGQQLFPSPASFAWYVRSHRQEMIEAGVLVKFRNSWHVDADRLPEWIADFSREHTRCQYVTKGLSA